MESSALECTFLIEIELEIHCKTIIETELKYIVNNGIEIETEIYLITDTTLKSSNASVHNINPVRERKRRVCGKRQF